MARAKWNGMEVMCALLGTEAETSTTGGRAWGEKEYCVDPQEGLLRLYSEAPGSYVTYDYTNALHFHGRTLAREIGVAQGSEIVLQIHIESMEDPDPSMFAPTKKMLANGPGIVLRAPIRLNERAASPSSGTVQPVIVHAAIDNQDKAVEAELLQSGDSNLDSIALKLVKRAPYSVSHFAEGLPVQDEAFIQVSFDGVR